MPRRKRRESGAELMRPPTGLRRELDELRNSDPQLAALDSRLADVLRGKETARDTAERIRIARRIERIGQARLVRRRQGSACGSTRHRSQDRRRSPGPARLQRAGGPSAALCVAVGKAQETTRRPTRSPKPSCASNWLAAELASWAKFADAGTAEMKAKVGAGSSSTGRPTLTSPASATKSNWPSCRKVSVPRSSNYGRKSISSSTRLPGATSDNAGCPRPPVDRQAVRVAQAFSLISRLSSL